MRIFILLFVLASLVYSQSFEYSQDQAKSLAAFSLAAYCKKSSLEAWNCGFPCQQNPGELTDVKYLYNPKLDATGYIGYYKNQDAIVLAFRGSTNFKNWMANINAIKTKYPYCDNGCQVHQGFYDQFNQIKSQVESNFNTLRQKYPNSKIFITGHSLGAAVGAHSVPFIYKLNGNKQIDVFYNFGSPRVGDQKYSSWFNSQNFAKLSGRITNGADPIVHLPPMGLQVQYYHYNQEIFYPSFKSKGTKHVQCGLVRLINANEKILKMINILIIIKIQLRMFFAIFYKRNQMQFYVLKQQFLCFLCKIQVNFSQLKQFILSNSTHILDINLNKILILIKVDLD